eukprot:SAG31_NODE_7857_length_1582_cov_1.264329_4_plen_124_part_00
MRPRGTALLLLLLLLLLPVHAVRHERIAPLACVRNPGGGGPAMELPRGAEAVACGVRAPLATVPANGGGMKWRASPKPKEVQEIYILHTVVMLRIVMLHIVMLHIVIVHIVIVHIVILSRTCS